MSDPEKRITIEDVLGEWDFRAFRVRWRVLDYWADLEVYEIVSVGDEPLFNKKGWVSSEEQTTDIDEAEPYVTGYIKWDGCTEFDFGSHHWCGPHFYKLHIDLLTHLYRRAYELMGREPFIAWGESVGGRRTDDGDESSGNP